MYTPGGGGRGEAAEVFGEGAVRPGQQAHRCWQQEGQVGPVQQYG